MKTTLIIASLIFISFFAKAQEVDNVRESSPVKDSAEVKKMFSNSKTLASFDSTSIKLNKGIKKRRAKANSVVQHKDSLKAVQKWKEQRNKFDSLQTRAYNKTDSIQSLLDPSAIIQRGVVNTQSKLDSVKQNLIGSKADSVQGKISEAKSKTRSAISKINDPLEKAVAPFNDNGAALPSSMAIPSLSGTKIPSLPATNNTSISLPSQQSPVTLPKVDASSVVNLDRTEKITGEATEKLSTERGKISEVTKIEALDEFKEKTGAIKEAGQEVEDVKKEGAGKAAEEAVANTQQVKGISKELSQADKLKQYYDPEVAKEAALNKVKLEAVNHFAGHEQELKAVMEQLTNVKAKIPEPEGVIDMFAKTHNTQKGKKWYDRLIYGVNLQVQKPASIWLDVNPYILYKISDKFNAGAGWNSRFSYNMKEEGWKPKENIYGPRATVEWKAKKDFALKADAECMNGVYPSRIISGQLVEYQNREWTWSYFAGVKKSFQLSGKLKGNVQMLYNLYNPKRHSPYSERLNVRIGFEWVGKWNRTKTGV